MFYSVSLVSEWNSPTILVLQEIAKENANFSLKLSVHICLLNTCKNFGFELTLVQQHVAMWEDRHKWT